MPCTEQDFQEMPLDFVRGSQAIMWNNGTQYPIPHAAKYVDDSVCDVVPKGSTWARNPIPRIHTDNIGMAFVGKCLDQRPNKDGPPGAFRSTLYVSLSPSAPLCPLPPVSLSLPLARSLYSYSLLDKAEVS